MERLTSEPEMITRGRDRRFDRATDPPLDAVDELGVRKGSIQLSICHSML